MTEYYDFRVEKWKVWFIMGIILLCVSVIIPGIMISTGNLILEWLSVVPTIHFLLLSMYALSRGWENGRI